MAAYVNADLKTPRDLDVIELHRLVQEYKDTASELLELSELALKAPVDSPEFRRFNHAFDRRNEIAHWVLVLMGDLDMTVDGESLR